MEMYCDQNYSYGQITSELMTLLYKEMYLCSELKGKASLLDVAFCHY